MSGYEPDASAVRVDGVWQASGVAEMVAYEGQGYLDLNLYRSHDHDNRVLTPRTARLKSMLVRIHHSRCSYGSTIVCQRGSDPKSGIVLHDGVGSHIWARFETSQHADLVGWATEDGTRLAETGLAVARHFPPEATLRYEIWYPENALHLPYRMGCQWVSMDVTDVTLVNCIARCKAACIAFLARSIRVIPWHDIRAGIAQMIWGTRYDRDKWNSPRLTMEIKKHKE